MHGLVTAVSRSDLALLSRPRVLVPHVMLDAYICVHTSNLDQLLPVFPARVAGSTSFSQSIHGNQSSAEVLSTQRR